MMNIYGGWTVVYCYINWVTAASSDSEYIESHTQKPKYD